ncbi:hypothetical protein [Streptomyces varsoviensis]|uniref:hypothetical protein n=1 Tax=Streptomyces varsoviensis TaxID=67373 RepID=UPI0004C8AA87|nr:hypothetical protein [Streptomyces varsoviensis]
MIAADRTAAPDPPHDAAGGSTGGPAGPGRRPRRRWLKPLIVFLLITIPAGYLYISAMQSRGGGDAKQEQAARKGLEEGWPSRLQRRVYGVWIPPYSADVASYETNSWKHSSLYLQFTTSAEGFERFLNKVGSGPDELEAGEVTIDDDQADEVGWKFEGDHHWTGTVHTQKKPLPTLQITANLDDPEHPRVFTVSTSAP